MQDEKKISRWAKTLRNKHTRRIYTGAVYKFMKQTERPLRNMGYEEAEEFILEVIGDGQEGVGVAHKRRAAILNLITWLGRAEDRKKWRVLEAQIRGIKLPTLYQKTTEPMTLDEIKAMFDVTKGDPRETALLYLLCYTAGRASTLTSLEKKDVFPQEGKVVFRSIKRRKVSKHYISPLAMEVITTYMDTHNSKYVLGLKQPRKRKTVGGRWQDVPVSEQTVLIWVKQIAKRAGLNKNVYTHLFRHSIGNLIKRMTTDGKGGADYQTIQGFLDHKDSRTTMNIYAPEQPEERKTKQQAIASELDALFNGTNHGPVAIKSEFIDHGDDDAVKALLSDLRLVIKELRDENRELRQELRDALGRR